MMTAQDWTRLFKTCGETGIRTLDTLAGITVFETVPFNHSGISPICYPNKNSPATTGEFYYDLNQKLTLIQNADFLSGQV